MQKISNISGILSFCIFCLPTFLWAERPFNGVYSDRNLEKIAFPIGGIGSGMFCLEGNGSISHMSVRNHMEFFNEPATFAAICVKGETTDENVAKVLEGPVPDYKYFGRPGSGLGSGERTYGLPRFANATFDARFPFCNIILSDPSVPLDVEITGFSPFIPNEADLSSWPAGSIDYALTNRKNEPIEAVFSLNSRNFLNGDRFAALKNGFRVVGPEGEFAFAVQGSDVVFVDHCWFRGGWFDSLSITWENVRRGTLINNPPVENNAPGASLFLPFKLAPNETKTIRILTAWFVPKSNLNVSNSPRRLPLDARPARKTADGQSPVSGYRGDGLVNTFYPNGDAQVGEIVSPEFKADKKYLHFLVGGGSLPGVGVALAKKSGSESKNPLAGDDQNPKSNAETNAESTPAPQIAQSSESQPAFQRIQTARGRDDEKLAWTTWELDELRNETLRIEIFDQETGGWGHINADQFLLTDLPLDAILSTENFDSPDVERLADFEGERFGDGWTVETIESPESLEAVPPTYSPWIATRFSSIDDVLTAFDSQYDELRRRSALFAQLWEKTTLPPELLEAVEANLTILKSPTILRQQDGRLWGWEGNQDEAGSCAGTCTHVWNYAQSICHLFPALERTFRQTEFHESLTPEGRQAFRANLPIAPGGIAWDASDGQLGCVMRLHREWRISGSDEFLNEYWPLARRSLDYCIRTWDPDETGLLEKSHHNTYDINYLGPEGHCGSFYLGALAAAIKMGEAAGQDVSRYRSILKKGRTRMENELFNGEYFIQKIPETGTEGNPDAQSEYYKDVARAVDSQGPKYQYGNGCLSDGVLGFWMAKVCGIDDDLVDPAKVRSHLLAVYRYNFKPDLTDHANPQRPTYAFGDEGGLLLCSWPRGDKPLLPFVYSDEVWTGIEYQVASHLMLIGEKEKGLDLVRACRKRYDGVRRNPFNEFECGHWYARAMSSFALLQAANGVRYDAVTKTLFFEITDENYAVPLFTEFGYGIVRFDSTSKTAAFESVEGTLPIKFYQPPNAKRNKSPFAQPAPSPQLPPVIASP